jgi:LmbE family N-acetylglucosaminyl deacetylase
MKKSIFILIIFLAGCTGAKTDQLEVFYAPHADDEVLSMGSAIMDALDRSKEVHVVLLSKGKASRAINTVNKKLEAEGHTTITPEEFGEARVHEFKAAVKALGLDESNISILDLPDGAIPKENVAEIILKKEREHEKVVHHVMSDSDPHSDHAITGQVLRELINSEQVQTGRFYIPVQEHDSLPYEKKIKAENKNQQDRLLKALDAYGKWNPSLGSYSIGQISVSPYFEKAKTHMESRYHD